MPELAQRLRFDLANALTRNIKLLADLFQRARLAVIQAKAQAKHLFLTRGERVENTEQLSMWCTLAYAYPNVKFYVYTKNYRTAVNFLKGGLVPSNMTILFSVWGKHGVKEFNSVKHLTNVKAFMFDDGKMQLKPQCYCPTYHEKFKTSDKYKRDAAHTCDKCKLCFSGNIKVIACHDH